MLKRRIITILFLAIILIVGIGVAVSCGFEGDPMLDDMWARNIYPGIDNTYNIGSASLRWHDIYGYDGIINYITVVNRISSPLYMGENIQVTGKVQGDRLIGDVEGYSIDVVQASDLDIALNDTLDLVFLFEPSIIILDYSARLKHDTSLEVGHTTGHSVVNVTGVDTITYNLNMTTIFDNNGTMAMTAIQDSNTRILWAYGGNDGVDDSMLNATASWDTGTHTLTITFVTVNNTLDNNNFVEILATAYR